MINSIWSLCHACPAMPVDSRPPNMRNKSRWSEYPGPASEVVQRAPTSSGVLDPLLAQGVHYKSDEIHVHENLYDSLDDLMDGAGAADHRNDTGVVPKQTSSAHTSSQPSAGSQYSFRRSRSEGPSPYGTPARGQGAGEGLMALWAGRRRRLPAPETGDWTPNATGQTSRGSSNERPPSVSEYRLQFAWPPGGKPQGHHHHQIHSCVQKMPGEISHGPTQDLQPAVTSAAANEDHHVDEDVADAKDGKPRRRRYKTEYSKKFRPFSLYHYVDGKFQKSKEIDADDINSDPWYREVLELRKQAGSYKYRGWGSELLPDHMAEIYNKQLEVWEQVSRRSSLSALALASATPRSVSKEDKERITVRKGSPHKTSNRQPSSFKREIPKKNVEEVDGKREPSMTRQRPPSGVNSGKNKKPKASAMHTPASSSVAPGNRPNLGVIFHPASTGRSQSAGPDARNKKPPRTPSSATPSVHKPSSKIKPSKSENSSLDDLPPPMAAPTTTIIPPDDNDLPVVNQTESFEPVPDLALMKSPPEPTRVKSPEQLVVRSPDPVNWTVPLDTGKTFTVTSNIREGELTRPHSELKFSMSVRPPALKAGISSLDSVHVKPMAPTGVTPPMTGFHNTVTVSPLALKETGMAPLPGGKGGGSGGGALEMKLTNGEHESREESRVKTPSPVQKEPPADLNSEPVPKCNVETPNVSLQTTEAVKASSPIMEAVTASSPTMEAVTASSPTMEATKASPPTKESPPTSSPVMEVLKTSPVSEVLNGEPEHESRPVTKSPPPMASTLSIQESKPKEVHQPSPPSPVLPKVSQKVDDSPAKPGSLTLAAPTEEAEPIRKETSEKSKEMPEEKKESTPILKSVPRTTLRCLEDPVFGSIPPLAPSKPRAPYRVLEAPTFPTAVKPSPVPSSSSALPQYRVLEAQGPSDVMYQPISSAFPVAAPSASPYRVLEAPGSSKAEASSPAPSLVSPSTGRSLASDVLEKARTRFDRFWGGKKDDK